LAGVTNSFFEVACQAKKSDEKHIQAFTQNCSKNTRAITTAITSKTIQKEVTNQPRKPSLNSKKS
jgi:hypothetical protein